MVSTLWEAYKPQNVLMTATTCPSSKEPGGRRRSLNQTRLSFSGAENARRTTEMPNRNQLKGTKIIQEMIQKPWVGNSLNNLAIVNEQKINIKLLLNYCKLLPYYAILH
jgi:hypothetical protein